MYIPRPSAAAVILALCGMPLDACRRAAPPPTMPPTVARVVAPSGDAGCPGRGPMDFHLSDTPVRLPSGRDVTALTVDHPFGVAPTLTAFRVWLDTTHAIDPCDESIQAWQYAPWFDGTFTVADGGVYRVAMVLGRGVVTAPDGRRTMFDGGARDR